MNKTVFQKIIDRELPAEFVLENEHVFVIRDKYPKAPVHLLVITRKVIPSIQEMQPEDFHLLGEIASAAQAAAEKLGVAGGYRLLTNVGTEAGQAIFHLHFHLLGGKPLGHLG